MHAPVTRDKLERFERLLEEGRRRVARKQHKQYGLIRRIWCWLTHSKHWHAYPVYHSWAVTCKKCGRTFMEYD